MRIWTLASWSRKLIWPRRRINLWSRFWVRLALAPGSWFVLSSSPSTSPNCLRRCENCHPKKLVPNLGWLLICKAWLRMRYPKVSYSTAAIPFILDLKMSIRCQHLTTFGKKYLTRSDLKFWLIWKQIRQKCSKLSCLPSGEHLMRTLKTWSTSLKSRVHPRTKLVRLRSSST